MIKLIIVLALITPALAHDEADWIRKGGFKRPGSDELCCGEHDCSIIRGVQSTSLPAPGYRLPSGEFVAQTETQPSPDGLFWYCKRRDGTRRCFFGPVMTQ